MTNATIIRIDQFIPAPGWGVHETKITIQTDDGLKHTLTLNDCVCFVNKTLNIGDKGDLKRSKRNNKWSSIFVVTNSKSNITPNATITKTSTELMNRNGFPDWPVTLIEITTDDGEIHVLDDREVRVSDPKVGMRGILEYRVDTHGAREFFDVI